MSENDINLQDGVKISSEIENKVIELWKSITIANDFVFCKVMQDEELLSELIRLVLPELNFIKLYIQAQKTVEVGADIHGVRFDIFAVLDDGSMVVIEIQVINRDSIPKRLRFYGSMADTQMLDKGVVYSKLKDSYVVMIAPFDFYGQGRHIYTFTNRCRQDHNLEMGDGTTKIVLNANGTIDDVSEKLKAFLDYVAGKAVDDEYVKKLDEAVQKARMNKMWRREYMTLMMRDLENREIGREERDREKISEMLRDGRTPQAIADFCKYPLQLVQEVQQSMLVNG